MLLDTSQKVGKCELHLCAGQQGATFVVSERLKLCRVGLGITNKNTA